MITTYVDTSAVAKLLVSENETFELGRWMTTAQDEGATLVSSLLLETELRRFAVRSGLPQSSVTAVLDGIELAELPPSLFTEAGLLGNPTLRALDALHLASAIRLDARVIVTYDTRMRAAADALGLVVTSPS